MITATLANKTTAFFFFFLVTGSLLAQPANAQSKAGFSLSAEPAYQEIEIVANELSVETVITFTNSSDSPQHLEFFAFDFKQTDHFGSLALLEGVADDYPHTLASFISFNKDSVVIPPKSSEELLVRVENRASLTPGGHYAAVVARGVTDTIDEKQKIIPALSALLLVRKTGGERPHLSLTKVDWDTRSATFTLPKKVTLTFQNDGNVHVIPRGSISVTDVFGTTVAQGTINETSSYVLPGTIRELSTVLKKSRPVLPLTLISVSVEGYTTIGNIPFTAEQSFLYIDFWFLIVLGMIITAVVLHKKIKKLFLKLKTYAP